MKRVCSIICFLSVALALPARFLKTCGTSICNNGGSGGKVHLHGINLGSLFVLEPWMSPLSEAMVDDFSLRTTLTSRFGVSSAIAIMDDFEKIWITEKDFAIMKEHGLNTVRVPIYDATLYNLDRSVRSDAFIRLDSVVAMAEKYGLWVIIDVHGVPGSQNGADHSGRKGQDDYWSNENNLGFSVNMWTLIATHYAGNATVAGYDLLNEPSESQATAMVAIYVRMYNAIRAVDQDHIVIMEGPFSTSSLPNPSTKGWDNVMYQLHWYNWAQTTSASYQIQTTNSNMADARHVQNDYGIPIYIGEFNFFGCWEAWKYAINMWYDEDVHWTIWAYKHSEGTGSNSWGLVLHNNPVAAKPNFSTDSMDTIISILTAHSTESSYSINTELAAVLSNFSAHLGSQTTSEKSVSKALLESGIPGISSTMPLEQSSVADSPPESQWESQTMDESASKPLVLSLLSVLATFAAVSMI